MTGVEEVEDRREGRGKRREWDRQFNSGCDPGGGGETYGTQPAEQWKTVVQANDPQPDRYGPHRKDGQINSQEVHEY